MNNPLNGSVQIVNFSPVIWYTPAGFPSVQTDATLLDGDGDLLLISNGMTYKLISVQQVKRIVSARTQEQSELYQSESEDYDAAQR
jgi:hypothetical protein